MASKKKNTFTFGNNEFPTVEEWDKLPVTKQNDIARKLFTKVNTAVTNLKRNDLDEAPSIKFLKSQGLDKIPSVKSSDRLAVRDNYQIAAHFSQMKSSSLSGYREEIKTASSNLRNALELARTNMQALNPSDTLGKNYLKKEWHMDGGDKTYKFTYQGKMEDGTPIIKEASITIKVDPKNMEATIGRIINAVRDLAESNGYNYGEGKNSHNRGKVVQAVSKYVFSKSSTYDLGDIIKAATEDLVDSDKSLRSAPTNSKTAAKLASHKLRGRR